MRIALLWDGRAAAMKYCGFTLSESRRFRSPVLGRHHIGYRMRLVVSGTCVNLANSGSVFKENELGKHKDPKRRTHIAIRSS